MKNIADVNSDDILTELNNLDYIEEDLKLLDDEDIRPIGGVKDEIDDLADFYVDYDEKKEEKKQKIDLYTEKPKVEDKRNFNDYSHKVNKLVEHQKNNNNNLESTRPVNVDSYLNRSSKIEEIKPLNSYESSIKPKNNNIHSNNNLNREMVTKPLQQKNNSNYASKVESKDLNQLFNKISNNVKGASELVNRNAEIRKKIDGKFDELRRLQLEHENNKKKDYAEINAYKDEVYTKLQQKKADIEKDLNNLRSSQDKFEKEKKEFEIYKNNTLANFKKLEDELKTSYDNRNKNIEQVELGLVKRKEQLDTERNILLKEREQLEKEREELASNLMQFNKLVDDFTSGIDNFD